MSSVIVQKIEKKCLTDIDIAIKYYTVLFSLNDLYPSLKEVELLAFTAIRGTLTGSGIRREFIDRFYSSSASMENIKCKLVKKQWLMKIDGKIKVNPVLSLDFSGDLIIQIKLFKDYDRVQSESGNTVRQAENRVSQESVTTIGST
jgi:hypothetical protein